MSVTRTATEQVEIEYKVEPVREDGRVVALEIRKWVTTTQLSANGNRKRGTDHEFTFEDVAVIPVSDVSDLVASLTGTLIGALSDKERGLV